MALMPEPVILDEDRVPSLSNLKDWPRVLAVDPGVTSGWAVVWFDDDKLFNNMESVTRAPVAWWCGMWLGPELGHMHAFRRMLQHPLIGGDGLGIVIEDFILRSNNMDRELLSPVRITARIEAAMELGTFEADGVARRRKLIKRNIQQASDAKTTITDARLQIWQMYLPGKDHPRDAMRHALLWLRRLRAGGEEMYNDLHFIDKEED